MKHWYLLAAIAMMSPGTSACSGQDGGGIATTSNLHSDQDPIFNLQLPADNPNAPLFNSQDPAQNPQQPAFASPIGGGGAGVTCEQFCGTVPTDCLQDCLPLCERLALLGDICLAETGALFTCALHADFTCEDGELRGGDACDPEAEAWNACIEMYVQDQGDTLTPNQPSGGAAGTGG